MSEEKKEDWVNEGKGSEQRDEDEDEDEEEDELVKALATFYAALIFFLPAQLYPHRDFDNEDEKGDGSDGSEDSDSEDDDEDGPPRKKAKRRGGDEEEDDEDDDEDEEGSEEEAKDAPIEEPADGLNAEDVIGGLDAPRASRSRASKQHSGEASAAKKKTSHDGEEAELSDF